MSETGGNVLVYSYTFAPGTPQTWTDRIGRSVDSLADAARVALREVGDHAGYEIAGTLHLGAPSRGDHTALVPFAWDLPDLCGRLDGELRLSEGGSGMTQISLRASYPTGDAVDGIHALTEYAAKAFVDRIPLTVDRNLPPGPRTRPPIVPTP